MHRTALALLMVFGTGCADQDYALPPPIAPNHYELARQRDWICRQDANRKDVRAWGIALTTVGAVAAASGAAWIAGRASNDHSVTTGPIALTVGGTALFGGGAFLLHDAARRSKRIEDAREEYAANLEDSSLDPDANSQCTVVTPDDAALRAQLAAAKANAAATSAEQAAKQAREAAEQANKAGTKACEVARDAPQLAPIPAASVSVSATGLPSAAPAPAPAPTEPKPKEN